MTTTSHDAPLLPPAEPWLDRLRQGGPAQTTGADAAFADRVLAAWTAAPATDAARRRAAQEPWLEHLAADAHAPKPEAFVLRTAETFAETRARRGARRRALGRIAFTAAGLCAAFALAVGLRLQSGDATPPLAVVEHAPSKGGLLAPLQASAEAWLEQHQERLERQMERQVTATLAQAKDKTSALLADYALPVGAARLILAPVVPALVPVAPAAPAQKPESGGEDRSEPRSMAVPSAGCLA